MSVQQNLTELKQELPAGCKLIAVSKNQPAEKIMEAYNSGHRIFGENRVQELTGKYELLPKDIEWHLIGHLQSNKVKYIVPFVSMIHSIDSPRLLEEINKQAKKANRVVACLLQVHIAEEDTKFGFSPEEVTDLINAPVWQALTHVKIQGLMGMATFTDDQQQVRREFRSLRSIFDNLRSRQLPAQVTMQELSMGMSGDYKLAIEEGSTMVRVGTAIFGERSGTITQQ